MKPKYCSWGVALPYFEVWEFWRRIEGAVGITEAGSIRNDRIEDHPLIMNGLVKIQHSGSCFNRGILNAMSNSLQLASNIAK